MSEKEKTNVTGAGEMRLEGNMNTLELVLSVLAFSAPLVTVAGTLPVLLMFGGNSAPSIYVVCLIALTLFSVGFVKMGISMQRPGGFYAFITDGLGRSAGLGCALLAGVSYAAIGYFAPPLFGITANALIINSFHGPNIPWYVWAFALILVNGFFAYRKIDLSAKVLSVVMILEIIVVVTFDLVTFANGGPADGGGLKVALPQLTSTVGFAFLFAVGNFMGFEATVIYREEVRNPNKTIPRATYISVVGIGIFYAIAAVAYVAFYGANNVQQGATDNLTGLFYVPLEAALGKVILDVGTVLVLTSTMASMLSIQNVASRYFYNLGTDGALASFFGKVHPKHHSPYVAATIITVIYVVATVIFAITMTEDPTIAFVVASGAGTLGVMLIMFTVSIAVIVYFRKNKVEGSNAFNSLVAPLVAAIFLGVIVIMAATNYNQLTGQTGLINGIMLTITFALPIGGFIYANMLKSSKPEVYQKIGRNLD